MHYFLNFSVVIYFSHYKDVKNRPDVQNMTEIPFSVEIQHFLLRVLLVLLSSDLGSESLPDPAVFRPPQPSHSYVAFFLFLFFLWQLLSSSRQCWNKLNCDITQTQ